MLSSHGLLELQPKSSRLSCGQMVADKRNVFQAGVQSMQASADQRVSQVQIPTGWETASKIREMSSMSLLALSFARVLRARLADSTLFAGADLLVLENASLMSSNTKDERC